jgi:hypothetical protein
MDVISRIKIGEKGLAYAVDSQGRLIAHPSGYQPCIAEVGPFDVTAGKGRVDG